MIATKILAVTALGLAAAGVKTAALNHEIRDNTVKYSTVVMAVFAVLQEVGGGFGGFGEVEFEDDIAMGGMQRDHGVPV